MRIWQATWNLRGNFIIWGEKSEVSHQEKRVQTFTKEEASSRTKDSHLHPFSCSGGQLKEDLSLFDFEAQDSRTVDILLPTDRLGPRPSPKLVFELEREGEPQLAYWSTTAISLEPVPALSLLTSLPKQLPHGIKLDFSFQFWVEATKFLLDLLARGRYLPGLVRRDHSYCSQWLLLTDDKNDHERLSILADCMPPICRAVLQESPSQHPDPSTLLESFLSGSADALIRTFLLRSRLLPDIDKLSMTPRRSAQVRWLRSLTSSSPIVEGPGYELHKLEQSLKKWGGRLLLETTRHELKTCFRLYPPESKGEETEHRWIVEFLLQSTVDSSQQITAAQIWKGDLGFLQRTDMSIEELEDSLLKSLSVASSALPELREALRYTHPTHLSLDTAQAYRFLREQSKVLEQMGFGIVVPIWWNEPTTKLGLHLTVHADEKGSSKSTSLTRLGTSELLDYSWEVSLGERFLSVEEFRRLVDHHTPLLQINNQWIELQQDKIETTLDFLDKQDKAEQMRLIDAFRYGFGLEDERTALPVVGFSATGWVEKLLRSDCHSIPQLSEPLGFIGTLRPYQKEGLSWLSFLSAVGIGGCLADDMGLGKTVQFLALLLYERKGTPEDPKSLKPNPSLLFVPMSILENWELEAKRFSPEIKTYLHHGPSRLSGKDFLKKMEEIDLIVTTYSLAFRDEDLFSQISWGRIALDEAQNIKNLDTKQTQAVRRITMRQLENRDGTSECHRVALTGTPLENHLEELWSIFDFLNPGFLGTMRKFRERFVLPIERYRNKEAAETLSKLVRPFVIRRLKTDPTVIDDLPEKLELEVFTSLTPEQAALYQRVVEGMLPQVEAASGIHRKGLVLSTITKLKQICNHPSLYLKDDAPLENRSGKLARLEELLEVILSERDKVLIFTQYAQFGHLIKPYLQQLFDIEVLFLHGALPKTSRQKLIERFQQASGPPVFLLSLKAGGYGLNLTEANQVIHFDQWWNPAVEEQATDRAFRIGQKRNVQVRKFICRGTLEERILEMLKHKKHLANQVVGSTKSVVTELSTDELRRLLDLNSDTE